MAQDPVVSEAESNYFKISTLLLRIAPKAVRIKFDDVFKPEHLKDTLKFNSSKLADLKNHKCINQSQWNAMFPRKDDPTSTSFDTTLMICLFRNIEGIRVTNQHPTPTDFSIGADLSRIKRYRRDIAYSKGRTFTNVEFTFYWNEAEAAVIRLSGGLVKGECCNLKTKTYDVVKRKHTQNLIHASKRLVRIEELNEVADRVEKIDLKQANDKNRDFLENQIKEWEEEKKWFVQTNAFKFILSNLDKRMFTIVGNPGMGKSMLLHQTALFLHESKDYSIISCQSPADIDSQFRKDTNQVFVLDDVCGQFTTVQSNVDQWNQYEIRIQKVVNSGNSVILASCRSQVFRESQCQNLSIFSGFLCDLNQGDCAIDHQQKLKIADKYLSLETIMEITSDLDSFDMFPLSCKLYKDREIKESINFFHDPFKFYTEELDSLYKEEGGLKFFSLFLCVLHSGRLNQEILMEDSEFSQALDIMLEKLELKQSSSRQSILDGLDALLNMYLSKKDGQYNVLHNRLFDFLCYYFGQRYQQLIINHADSEIIRDRTLFKSLNVSTQDFIILIDTAYEKEYIERLVRDMLSGYIDDVLYNHQIQFKDFRYKLLSHLQEYDDDDETVPRVLSEYVMDEKEKTSQLLPVNFACKYGFSELFTFFLSKTKDVNAYEGNNIPLITACRKGDKYMTSLLLEKGADVNQTDSLGCSPLLWSCVYGNLDIIDMLLNKKADVHNIDVCSKSSSLIWACVGEFLHICDSISIKNKLCSTLDVNEIISLVVENINEQFVTQEDEIELFLTILQKGCTKGCVITSEKIGQGTHTGLMSVMKKMMKMLNNDETKVKHDVNIQPNTINQTFPLIDIMNIFLDRGVDIDKSSIGGVTALLFACLVGTQYSESITYLLSKGANVNICDIEGTYPLHIAIRLEKEEVVKLLIGKGAIVNCPVGGIAPIETAITNQNISIVDSLINAGANINPHYENGTTLLHYAVTLNNVELIKSLLKGDISVNCINRFGNTALIDAVKDGLADIVEVLIKEGAEVNFYSPYGMSPLTIAISEQNISLVDFLIQKGADINKRYDGLTLLHYAIQYNNADIIKRLIKAGIPVNCRINNGMTPLMIAVNLSLANITEVLIREGAEVDIHTVDGQSTLMIASSKGDADILKMILKSKKQFAELETLKSVFLACMDNHKEVVSLLLQQDCDINVHESNHGNTCLIEASDRGFTSIVSLLLKQGADVNASNYAKETPLTLACIKGHTAVVRLLIAGKADMYKSNKSGESSLILACLHNHLEVVKVLLDNGCNIESFEKKTEQTGLSVASYHAYDKIVTYLIEQGAKVNTQSSKGNTPLILAASKGNLNIVKILIEQKADVNIQNVKGSTSLSLASSKGLDEIVTYLIEHEADVNTQSNIGTTPLILAASNGHLNIVKKLIESKADVNIQNDKGSTCLSVASSKGFENIVTYLLDQKASINTAKYDGDSPLMLASKNGHVSNVKILLENGAKVDMKNKEGLSSLDLARKSKHVEIADIICEFIQQNSE